MNREHKLRVLRGILGEGREKGDEVVFFCPKHPASVGRSIGQLSINLKTDWFNCWSCGFSGKNLVQILRLRRDLPEFQEYLEELQKHSGEEKAPEKKYVPAVLPKEFRSLSVAYRSPYYKSAMEYLIGRGITSDDILRFKLGYCESGTYRNRIIIPSFDEFGEINFCVGRSFYADGSVRYKHEEIDKNIIFNDYLIDWSQPISLVEGPFDSMKAGENAIPLQGSSIREDSRLFSKIVTRGTPVYFALDSDMFKRQMKIIKKFLAYGIDCHYVSLGKRKDVGEMGSREFALARDSAMRIKDEFDILRMLLA